MNYKVSKTLKDNKKNLIIIAVLWIFFAIVLVAPIGVSVQQACANGGFDFNIFLTNLFPEFLSFTSITKAFAAEYIGYYFKSLLYFTILYLIFTFIGLFRSKPKHEYTDIEHGSSDWSEGGEQYSILSKNKGIILSKHNFLPTDKRGNVNVLVVGRIWIW